MRRHFLHFALFIVYAGLLQCIPMQPARALEEFAKDRLTIVTANGARHHFRVEIASTPNQRAQGLQFRKRLEADAGMLFDFRSLQPVAMWMKNTFVSLDMIFITSDGRISKIARKTTPESLVIIESSGLVKAVLEVPGGTTAGFGINPGDRVEHAIFK